MILNFKELWPQKIVVKAMKFWPPQTLKIEKNSDFKAGLTFWEKYIDLWIGPCDFSVPLKRFGRFRTLKYLAILHKIIFKNKR